jgi:hypothetical protein
MASSETIPRAGVEWTRTSVFDINDPSGVAPSSGVLRAPSPFTSRFVSPGCARVIPRARTPEREDRVGRPGSRRHRRIMNDKFLSDQAEQLSKADLQLALSIERTVPSPWMFGSSHNDHEYESRWNRFVELTADEQAKLLAQPLKQQDTKQHIDRQVRRRTSGQLYVHCTRSSHVAFCYPHAAGLILGHGVDGRPASFCVRT